MRFFTGEASFQFPWDQVAAGFWHRYPNPYSKHVLTEDAVVRKVTENNELHSVRILSKTNKVPKWGERFVPKTKLSTFIVEESYVDPTNKVFTTYTRNIGHNSVMTVEEKCTYRPDPNDSSSTVCHREAWISSSLFGFSYAIQKFGYERFKSNVTKAVKGYDFVLHKLYVPESLPVYSSRQLNLNKDAFKSTAKMATDAVREKAKEKVTAVASYAGGATTN